MTNNCSLRSKSKHCSQTTIATAVKVTTDSDPMMNNCSLRSKSLNCSQTTNATEVKVTTDIDLWGTTVNWGQNHYAVHKPLLSLRSESLQTVTWWRTIVHWGQNHYTIHKPQLPPWSKSLQTVPVDEQLFIEVKITTLFTNHNCHRGQSHYSDLMTNNCSLRSKLLNCSQTTIVTEVKVTTDVDLMGNNCSLRSKSLHCSQTTIANVVKVTTDSDQMTSNCSLRSTLLDTLSMNHICQWRQNHYSLPSSAKGNPGQTVILACVLKPQLSFKTKSLLTVSTYRSSCHQNSSL